MWLFGGSRKRKVSEMENNDDQRPPPAKQPQYLDLTSDFYKNESREQQLYFISHYVLQIEKLQRLLKQLTTNANDALDKNNLDPGRYFAIITLINMTYKDTETAIDKFTHILENFYNKRVNTPDSMGETFQYSIKMLDQWKRSYNDIPPEIKPLSV